MIGRLHHVVIDCLDGRARRVLPHHVAAPSDPSVALPPRTDIAWLQPFPGPRPVPGVRPAHSVATDAPMSLRATRRLNRGQPKLISTEVDHG